MRKVILLSIISVLSCASFAQQKITGKVTDAEGNPLKSVAVGVKGNKINATTNENGNYEIIVSDNNEKLFFSKDQYRSQEATINGDVVDVSMALLVDYLFDLSLEEIMKIEVVTASNIKEKFSEVPATMIVITEQEIMERGYYSLSEIFNDLPGMDISRHFASQPFFNYWRGYRSAFSQPYLFMIDGILYNDIFYNQPQIIDNISLNSIHKIEIVYGPVSAVYGANAFMGVVNVITKSEEKEDGLSLIAQTRTSAQGDVIGDLFTQYRSGKFRTSLSVRFENIDFAKKLNLNDHYTNKNLLKDTLLWGDLALVMNQNNTVGMTRHGTSVDYRLAYGNTEIGAQVHSISNGWGNGTPFDKALPNALFTRDYYYTWVKQEFRLSENFTTTTNLRYRLENRSKGDWIEAYNYVNSSPDPKEIQTDILQPSDTARVIDYSLWPLRNAKLTFLQRFNLQITDQLFITSGIQFDQTHITKQEGVYGDIFTPNTVQENNPDFYPQDEGKVLRLTNKYIWKDYGIFSQAKYSFSDNHILNLGIRLDNNSEYGTSNTFRGGYIMSFNKFTMKLLYGQAYQVPTPRTLYSRTILGSSLDLKPETSETVELNFNYTAKNVSSWLSTYYTSNKNAIVFLGSQAVNIGAREVIGGDVYVNAIIPISFLRKFSVWAYYSTYFQAKENIFDDSGVKTGTIDIGDLSNHKVYVGLTTYLTDKLILNLRGRYKSERRPVATNPLKKIDAYYTVDANIVYRDLLVSGLDLGLKIENILDAKYYHPGINRANAGTAPGYWTDNGVWQGSKGWNNSLLPQPHRYVSMSLAFRF